MDINLEIDKFRHQKGSRTVPILRTDQSQAAYFNKCDCRLRITVYMNACISHLFTKIMLHLS